MKWTREQNSFLFRNHNKVYVGEIAETLGKTKDAVRQKAIRKGLKGNGLRRQQKKREAFNPFDQWNISRFVVEEMQKNKNG